MRSRHPTTTTGERRQRLLTLLDDINLRWGRGKLRCLAEGLVQPWRMRRERKTPGYTIDWRELPVVGLGARHPHNTHLHRLNNATT